jgi:hypothetical protein
MTVAALAPQGFIWLRVMMARLYFSQMGPMLL